MSVTVAQFGNLCACSTFEVVVREWEGEGGQPEMVTETTGCTARTRREFAPGHNSKLKSLLIRAGVNGWDVRRDMGGLTRISDAQGATGGFGFAHMVQAGIERGLAKVAAKAQRAARKATVAVEPAPKAAPVTTVQIKVANWEYVATIDEAGDAHYNLPDGTPVTAVAGVFKVVRPVGNAA